MSTCWWLRKAEQANGRTDRTNCWCASLCQSFTCVHVCVRTGTHAMWRAKQPLVPGATLVWMTYTVIHTHTCICVYIFAYIYLGSFRLFFKFLATSGHLLSVNPCIFSRTGRGATTKYWKLGHRTLSITMVIISYLCTRSTTVIL